MRIVPLFLVIVGCSTSQADSEPSYGSFRDQIDPDRFCTVDSRAAALGYRAEAPYPWTDQLFCINADGLFITTEAENAERGSTSGNNNLQSALKDVVWLGRVEKRDPHVTLADGLIDGCPDKSQPLAIIPLDGSVYPTGATITRGIRFCMEGSDLVLRDDTRALDEDPHREMNRWSGFTPIL